MEDETVQNLKNSVDKLNVNLERQNSLKFVIVRGFVYGVSIVLGTTILAGVVISLLNSLPIVEYFIEKFALE